MTQSESKNNPLLEVRNLQKYFPIQRGFLKRTVNYVRAVDGVSFHIKKGETFGLVGESGCGKTTTGRCIVRLIEPTRGEVVFHNGSGPGTHVEELAQNQLRDLRRNMQIIFQDPYSSLNPRLTIKRIVSEPLIVNQVTDNKQELEDRVAELLKAVGMPPDVMDRYPHAFSGGQRQRIGIARALALNPKLIVCDEPVSALDVSVQAQVLNLLQDLQQELDLTYLFVAHDLSVVKHISNRVAVMYVGKLVETAETKELYSKPRHPYTEALLSAVPKPDPRARRKHVPLIGEVANPANPPSGCYFHPRCRYAQDICSRKPPILRDMGDEHRVACHLAEELDLIGLEI